MTLGLDLWLRLLAGIRLAKPVTRAVPLLKLMRLSPRDLADLNLPPEVAGRLRMRQDADEQRRRVYP